MFRMKSGLLLRPSKVSYESSIRTEHQHQEIKDTTEPIVLDDLKSQHSEPLLFYLGLSSAFKSARSADC
jgi:hypothetical protein